MEGAPVVSDGNDPKIEYSVRELLIDLRRELSRDIADLRSDMNSKLDGVLGKLDGKASREELTDVRSKVDLLDNRVQAAETTLRDVTHARAKAEQTANLRRNWRQWAIPTLLSGLVALVYVLQLLGVGTHH